MSEPTITVGVPVYNGGAHLREVLESLLAQDYGDFEVIISDNCSTDDTPAVAREYVARDPRFRYSRNPENIGAVGNFNQLVRQARGKYFCWFADHDVHQPNFLSASLAALERDPEVVLACPRAVWIASDGSSNDEWIPPVLDTRKLPPVSRIHVLLWGIGFCYQVYGLMRLDALRRTDVYAHTAAPDIVLLTQLASEGTVAWVGEAVLGLRRLQDYGDWRAYTRKLQLTLKPWTAPLIFLRFIRLMARAGARAGKGFVHRMLVGSLVGVEAAIRYRSMASGLMRASFHPAATGHRTVEHDA